MKLWHSFTNFYSPDEAIPEPAPVSVLDIAEELGEEEGDEDEEQVGDKVPTERKGSEDKGDEEKERTEENIELVEEEADGESDDPISEIVNPLSRKALLKDYPDIFKKYPQLEKGYYASQKYREYFPTLDEAKEAAEKLEEYNQVQQELDKGDPSVLLAKSKDNPEAFAQVVDNYLPALGKVDPQAYYHVIGNIIKTTVIRMGKMAQTNKDDDLMTAAKILHGWAFGDEDATPPIPFGRGKNPEKEEIEKEKEDFRNQKLAENQDEVKGKVNSVLKGTIEQYIDPNERMTPFAKKAAVKEALEKVNDLLYADKELKKLSEKLWKTAQDNKFSSDSVGKIRRAYQERAKVILPQVIKKVRADALKGVERRSGNLDRKGPLPNSGRPSASQFSSGRKESPSKVPSGMSTLDFFNS